ncbi:MAG: hypothetical protein QXU23_02945 [Candidatus Korarchaeum sp.]
MRSEAGLLLVILVLQTLQAAGSPYLEVSKLVSPSGIEQVIMRDEYALLKTGEGLVLLEGGSGRNLNIGEGRLIDGKGAFFQSGGRLYEISGGGAREVAECGDCTFFPYSSERYAMSNREGLTLRMDGEEIRVMLRPQIGKWSDEGNYFAALSGSTLYVVSERGIIWSMSLTTQVFDIDLSKDLVILTTKNCEIYAYRIGKGVAWTNRLCGCCIPLKLASSSEIVAVALQGEELVLLDPSTGRVVQRVSIPAYSVQVHDGLIAALDSGGVVHVLADSSKLEVEGKSSGALLTWDLPTWLRGELIYEAGGRISISRRSFIPLTPGNVTLRLKDPNGVEVRREVVVKPLEVTLTPEGDVEVRGDGELSVRAQGRTYEGERVRVDTGFLPQYTVEILNYGVPIGKYSCYNSRFTMIALAAVLVAISALVLAKGFLASGSRGAYGPGAEG